MFLFFRVLENLYDASFFMCVSIYRVIWNGSCPACVLIASFEMWITCHLGYFSQTFLSFTITIRHVRVFHNLFLFISLVISTGAVFLRRPRTNPTDLIKMSKNDLHLNRAINQSCRKKYYPSYVMVICYIFNLSTTIKNYKTWSFWSHRPWEDRGGIQSCWVQFHFHRLFFLLFLRNKDPNVFF